MSLPWSQVLSRGVGVPHSPVTGSIVRPVPGPIWWGVGVTSILSWLGGVPQSCPGWEPFLFVLVPQRGQGYPSRQDWSTLSPQPGQEWLDRTRYGYHPLCFPQNEQATPRAVHLLRSHRRTFLFFECFTTLDFFTFVFTLKIHHGKLKFGQSSKFSDDRWSVMGK